MIIQIVLNEDVSAGNLSYFDLNYCKFYELKMGWMCALSYLHVHNFSEMLFLMFFLEEKTTFCIPSQVIHNF